MTRLRFLSTLTTSRLCLWSPRYKVFLSAELPGKLGRWLTSQRDSPLPPPLSFYKSLLAVFFFLSFEDEIVWVVLTTSREVVQKYITALPACTMIMLQTNKTAPILKLSTKTNAYLNSSVTLSGSGRGRSPFYMFSRSKSFLESRTAMTKSNCVRWSRHRTTVFCDNRLCVCLCV